MDNQRTINKYVDQLITEAAFSNPEIIKNAQVSSSIISNVKDYISQHLNQDDIFGSVFNILIPGILWAVFPGWISIVVGTLLNVFHIDLSKIILDIGSKLKSLVSGGNKISEADVNTAVHQTFSEHVPDFASLTSASSSNAILIRQAKLFKYAQLAGGLKLFSGIFPRILSFIFRTILGAGGFMLTGDVINHFTGGGSALDDSLKNNKPKSSQLTFSTTQTKFKLNSSYHDTQRNTSSIHWVEQANNNKGSIENMVIDFAKEIYSGLDDSDSVIKSTNGFNDAVDDIVFYNRASKGTSLVFIPDQFGSKKSLVDSFIDQVAQKS